MKQLPLFHLVWSRQHHQHSSQGSCHQVQGHKAGSGACLEGCGASSPGHHSQGPYSNIKFTLNQISADTQTPAAQCNCAGLASFLMAGCRRGLARVVMSGQSLVVAYPHCSSTVTALRQQGRPAVMKAVFTLHTPSTPC